jgi:hypothetical protein
VTIAARSIAVAAAALAVAALAPGVAAQAAAAPKVEQLVAFRDGSAKQSVVTAAAATARLGGAKRCAVGAGTPLAVLIRSKPGTVRLKDYGSCSSRAVDAGGLYVAAIGPDRARGIDGWVYKVGTKVATAGAGDPSGPFGRGRLKGGARVTWFYCHMNARTQSCQRTLGATAQASGGGALRVAVRAYDDRGGSKPAAGATVHAGSATAVADANGVATFTLPAGRVLVHAESKGAVRSFEEAVDVR